MAGFWETLDQRLKWLEHGYVFVQILASLGLGKLAQSILGTKIQPGYASAVWWLMSAAILFVLLWAGKKLGRRKSPVGQNLAVADDKVQYKQLDLFYQKHQGPMMAELEQNIRDEAAKHRSGDDRDNFFIRTFASMVLMSILEIDWYVIFKSQIKALERLNKGIATLDQLKPYFNMDADKRPQFTFEAWYGFLKNAVLVRQDGYNVGITVRGQEFLKYMALSGKTADDKTPL